MRALLTAAGAAERIGHKVEWFYKNRRRLQRDHNFPRPVAGLRLYDPAAIDAWLDRQIPGPAQASNDDAVEITLEARGAAIARSEIRSQKTELRDRSKVPVATSDL